MPEDYKYCTACDARLPIEEFRLRMQHGRPYRVAMCRPCERERSNAQRCPKKRREYERKRFSDPDIKKKKNKYQRQWRAENIEKNRAYHRKHIKKHVDKVSDSYIKRNYDHIDLTEDEIKLKRAQILIKRINKKTD